MTAAQVFVMTSAMRAHGGRFVKALADAMRCADVENTNRLISAFPEVVRNYGPGSEPFARVMVEGATL